MVVDKKKAYHIRCYSASARTLSGSFTQQNIICNFCPFRCVATADMIIVISYTELNMIIITVYLLHGTPRHAITLIFTLANLKTSFSVQLPQNACGSYTPELTLAFTRYWSGFTCSIQAGTKSPPFSAVALLC